MTRFALASCLAFAALLLSARSAHACAGCRNPSMPVARGNEGPVDQGALTLGLSLSGTLVDVVHEAGCHDLGDCHEVPVQPLYLHDQRLVPFELRALAEYGFDANFGVEVQVPFRMVFTSIEYTTPEGEPYEPLDRDVHHRNEAVAGFSDPWLLLRVGHLFDDLWLAARLGVTLPFGRTEEDPFALGDRGERHQHIQLGTGTFDPVLVLEASQPFGDNRLMLFAQSVLPLYENSHGYKAPFRVHGGFAVALKIIDDFAGKLGLEAMHEDAERWQGVIRQDGSLGRTEVLALIGIAQGIGDSVLSLDVRLPVMRHIVVGSEEIGELSSPLSASLRFTHVLPLGEETP